MRKGLVIVLAAILVGAFALPVMADTSLNGFIRSKGYVSNFENFGAGYISPQHDPATNSYVEQRARFLIKTGNENVKGIVYFEMDQAFGDSAYTTGRNLGGGLEADTTNLETKNLYVWFKVPNTSWDFSVGVFNATDSYAGIFFGVADMAGVFANFKYEPVAFRVGWAKWWENFTNRADDIDLYIAEAKFSPVKDVKLGLNFYFLNDMGGGRKGPTTGVTTDSAGDTIAIFGGRGAAGTVTPAEIAAVTGLRKVRIYMPGVDVAAKVGPVALTGFAFYQTGKAEGTGSNDVDIKGYAADLRGDVALGPGKGFIEVLYVSGDDNKTDTDYESIVTASNYNLAGTFYYRTDMSILLPNGDDINSSLALSYDMANGGAGIFHVGAGYSMPLMDKLTGKVGAGYLAAAKKRARDQGGAFDFANESAMGTEVNANLNYNITKGLDFGVYGAYAWLGSAYDNSGGVSLDPDNLYDVHARLNYSF